MFKNPFSFNGRIRRTEFGLSFIMYVIAYGLINVFSNDPTNPGMRFVIIFYIPVIWFLWAQGSKRCHDLDRSGWWQIIPFYVLWLLFGKGTPYENQYDTGSSSEPFYGASDYERPYSINDNDMEIIKSNDIVSKDGL